MPDFKRIGVIALAAALTIHFTLHRANAQAVIGVPVVETAIIGGIVYYVWQNWQGEEQRSTTYPMLEDPEDELQWGTYPSVKTYEGCEWTAAGRDWEWDRKTSTCYIKG